MTAGQGDIIGRAAGAPRGRWLARALKRLAGSSELGSGLLALYREVREDWGYNGASWFAPGFRAVALHRFGAWHLRAPRVLRPPLGLLYRALYFRVRNHYGIELPLTTAVGRRLTIGHQSGIVIHPDAVFGDDCVIRQNVTIGGVLARGGAPRLGDRVDVSAGAVIIGHVRIGDGARIGPNAVVTMDVPPGATVCAAPVRVIQLPEAQPPPRGGGAGAGSAGATPALPGEAELKLSREWKRVDEVMAAALARAEPVRRGHHVNVRLQEGLPAVYVDAHFIGEVVYRLIDNASKYTPPVTSIDVCASLSPSQAVQVAVEDRGRGIPRELRERVFDKFFRSPTTVATETGRPSGRGLGLTIARRIVEAHGGRIWIEEGGLGCGTRVVFEVPGSGAGQVSHSPRAGLEAVLRG